MSSRPLSMVLICALLGGCGGKTDWLASSGPSYGQVMSSGSDPQVSGIQIVEVSDRVARRLQGNERKTLFSEALGTATAAPPGVGAGDMLEITVWEAPPGMLFGSAGQSLDGAPAAAGGATLPAQMVNPDGTVALPFVGPLRVAGRTTQQIETEVVARLRGKAHEPQALVRVTQNASANVTVVGEVTNSARVPLTPRGERLLDAVAAVGGVRQPLDKVTVQVTRGHRVAAMPLQAVVRDPQQNIPLRPGDVIAALYQPLSFTVLGATGKNEEISFEAQGISLAQALARSGGLLDNRARASGAFVFRFEEAQALDWPVPPMMTPDGKVAVIYRVNLRDPAVFFATQNFPVKNKDILYVANAGAAETQKFLNLIISVVYPLVNVGNAVNNLGN